MSALFLMSAMSMVSAGTGVSIFNHNNLDYVKPTANVDIEYDDTEFGEYLYSEASDATRLEILRMISKDAPLDAVLLQGLSMGLGIDDLVSAAVRYDSEIRQQVSSSAISILPMLEHSSKKLFTRYQLDDLEKNTNIETYSVVDVAERFFEKKEILSPAPDWVEGQYAFKASAKELLEIISRAGGKSISSQWYKNQSAVVADIKSKRPIFVSLYQDQELLIIDDAERIKKIVQTQGEGALVPVVFIFNRITERAIDQLTSSENSNKDDKKYPATIRGVHDAFASEELMLTSVPEWQQGDYHIMAKVAEIKELFSVPEENDFDSEHWKRLLDEASKFKANDISFITVILPQESQVSDSDGQKVAQASVSRDPRIESDFPYVINDGEAPELKDLVAAGVFMLRLDLIAALDSIGILEVPVSFFYIDDTRTQPYRGGVRGIEMILGNSIGTPLKFGGNGGFDDRDQQPICASPPCSN